MSGRNVAIALAIAVIAVVLQTTLFVELSPFGASPNLVLLVVIAATRHLDPDPAVLFGFSAGLLTDLLGSDPLGMWALVMTVIAYATLRLRERTDEAPLFGIVMVLALTFFGEALFVLVGTLFGEKLLSQNGVARIVILTSVYNAILASAVLPAMTRLLQTKRRTWVLQ
jgi:rod shape-determining protein MreD